MFNYQGEEFSIPSKEYRAILVPMRLGVTPVPIPNTMVKTQAADGTALETVWESRWLPNSVRNKAKAFLYRYRHDDEK